MIKHFFSFLKHLTQISNRHLNSICKISIRAQCNTKYLVIHCALIEIAHCRSYKNDFGFCPFLSRLCRVNHFHDPPKTQVWSCSLTLKGSKTSPWFEIYCQWKGNSCTAPTAALQSAQWCIFIDLVWWQCEFTLFTLLHDMNMRIS